jgi:CheY-like chemotaxis protein
MRQTSKAAPVQLFAGRRILVVEDEYFLADDLHRHLASLGADIIGPMAYIDDAEAVLKAGESIDGALLDINIKTGMVFSLARTLLSRGVPFMFTTGYDKRELAQDFPNVQIWEKPLDIPRVTRALAALMSAG